MRSLLLAGLLVPLPVQAQQADEAGSTALREQFRNPPDSAKPRVWWHWVNGNVSEDGIEQDLDWMARVGIGGAQVFDVARPMASLVEKPLGYMSPEWRSALRTAAREAAEKGIELGIASSPGWSETGAPWVEPEDAMKKIVWSEITVTGGKRIVETLPLPPDVSGPYQAIGGDEHHGTKPTRFYRDSQVFAVPHARGREPKVVTSAFVDGTYTDAAVLQDGAFGAGIPLPGGSSDMPGSVRYEFSAPQTIRSARMFIANPPGSILAGPLQPRLEASDDGTAWRTVGTFPVTGVPSTIGFAPETARYFRLVLDRGAPKPIHFAAAPGVDMRLAGGLGGGAKPPVLTEFQLSEADRVNAAELKAAFAHADNYYRLDEGLTNRADAIDPKSVIDLTDRMDSEGRLRWTAPKGNWRIVRMGYSLTGKTNAPATHEATGLEVDKYDGGAVGRYMDRYLGDLREVTGPHLFGERGLSAFVTDSTEVRPANWTPRLVEAFERLRGYDPRPWLPTLTGAIVGSRARSDGFLYDFRRTLGDLATSEHYGTIAGATQKNGLTYYGEAIEGNREISSLGDDLEIRRHADIPMGAMWAFGGPEPAPHYRADMRGAASVAHFYGKPLVAAEALTSILQPWAYAPAQLQPMIDAAFLAGVNRPVIHSVVQQPRDDKRPGMSLQGFGQFFGRHEAWAELAKPWIDYISRTSFLLQQGHNVADVAYFYGEDTPISVIAASGYPADVPTRFAYDFVSPSGIAELGVVDGELVSPGGARYAALYLGGTSDRMTLPLLEQLDRLVAAGATIVGERPQASPALADDPRRFDALAGKLWSNAPANGRVIAGKGVEEALAALGTQPDFAVDGGSAEADIRFVHRRTDSADIYFVANRRPVAERIEGRFRVVGKAPSIWRADDGSVVAGGYRIDGPHTIVPLTLEPNESVFVVFDEPARAGVRTIATPVPERVFSVESPWRVTFEPGRGAPAHTSFDTLRSLTESTEPGIRYFSGIATYENRFALSGAAFASGRLWLDLGAVGDIAEVTVNGRPAGTAWKAPYRLDITGLARRGMNDLRIRVANRWVNRLIGDQQPGAAKIAETAIPTYMASAPLQPAGLIGPVTIHAGRPGAAEEGLLRVSPTGRSEANDRRSSGASE